MDSTDDAHPGVTDFEADEPEDENTAPLQPWLRRFASVVGFASTGTAPDGYRALS